MGSIVSRRLGALLLAFLASWAMRAQEAAADADTQALMRDIAASLAKALPAATSDSRFEDPAEREAFQRAVWDLAARSGALGAHGAGRERTFAHLSHSLARDAAEITRFVEDDDLSGARFMVGQLLENCVACHARLPSTGASPIGAQLVANVDLESLEPRERMRLLLATRQFDPALDEFERLLVGELESDPRRFDIYGMVVDYLIVNVRVRNDLSRPRTFLSGYARNEKIGKFLRGELEQWVASLEKIATREAPPSALDDARSLVSKGDQLRLYPADQISIVYDVCASGVLYRYVESHPEANIETAEAYYMLGAAESRLRRPSWIDRWDDYLEIAIRMAPGTQVARRAYRLLEDETLAEHADSWVLNLPREELSRLDELRALSEEAP